MKQIEKQNLFHYKLYSIEVCSGKRFEPYGIFKLVKKKYLLQNIRFWWQLALSYQYATEKSVDGLTDKLWKIIIIIK